LKYKILHTNIFSRLDTIIYPALDDKALKLSACVDRFIGLYFDYN
jgi:hypothetical protein